MTFPTLQGTPQNSSSGSLVTSHTINTGSPSNGDLLILIVHFKSAGQTITWPAGKTMTQIGRLPQLTNNETVAFYRRCDGTEGATITMTTSATTRMVARAWRWLGHHATSAPEAAFVVTGAVATPDPPNLAPSWGAEDNQWLTTAGNNNGTETVSAFPTNYINTGTVTTGASTGATLGYGTRQLNAAAENPGTFTKSATSNGVAMTLAIRPAGAALALAGATMDGRYGDKVRVDSETDLRARTRVLARSTSDARYRERVSARSTVDVLSRDRQRAQVAADVRYSTRALARSSADIRYSDLAQVFLAGALIDLRYAERQRAENRSDARWGTKTPARATVDVRARIRRLSASVSNLFYRDRSTARAVADLSYRELLRAFSLSDVRYREFSQARAVTDLRSRVRARAGGRADVQYADLSLAILAGAVADLSWRVQQRSGASSDVRSQLLSRAGTGADIRRRALVVARSLVEVDYSDLVLAGAEVADLRYAERVAAAGTLVELAYTELVRAGATPAFAWRVISLTVPVPELISAVLLGEDDDAGMLLREQYRDLLIEAGQNGRLVEPVTRGRLEE